MEFILFMLFSVLETYALYFLMFRLFKFDQYPASILFISLIQAYISYTLRTQFDMPTVDILLQVFLVFCFVWFLFKVQVFYAGIMTGTAYVGYMVVQFIVYFILNSLNQIPDIPDPLNIKTYLFQFISTLIALLIGVMVLRLRLGFDFIPHNQYGKFKLNRKNIVILILYIPAIISIPFTYYLAHSGKHNVLFFIPLVLGIVLISLLYWSYKMDRNYD